MIMLAVILAGTPAAAYAASQNISAGFFHGMFVTDQGTLWGWGDNTYGQLGNGPAAASPVPIKILGDVDEVSAGGIYNLVLIDGTLWSWGSNYYGQLGNGTDLDLREPDEVLVISEPRKLLEGVAAVSSGNWHSLALTEDGRVWAWGRNDYGQLGDGTLTRRTLPVQVEGLTNIIAVAAGAWHSMALSADGEIYVWGSNEYGQLGDGGGADLHRPARLAGLSGIKGIAAGAFHSLAIDAEGHVWSWGWNNYGQLGDGSDADSQVPIRVLNLAEVKQVSAGHFHNLALTESGEVWAWGNNEYGQLGDGTVLSRSEPVQTNGLHSVIEISAGGYLSLALDEFGQGWSWGRNDYGQLGDGTTEDRSLPGLILIPEEPPQPPEEPSPGPRPSTGSGMVLFGGSALETVDVQLFIDDVEYRNYASGTYANERRTIEVSLEESKLLPELEGKAQPAVRIKVNAPSEEVVTKLSGTIIHALAERDAELEIQTPLANYIIPASELSTADLLPQFSAAEDAEDIAAEVLIAKGSEELVQLAETAARSEKFMLVEQPVEFTIIFSDGEEFREKPYFRRYLHRELPLPDGVKQEEITTGVILLEDGSVRHAPTRFVMRDGTVYARISSLSNSPYILVHKSLSFTDMLNHWAAEEIQEMASRLIVFGSDEVRFHPDRPITRAELTVMVVRALGIPYSNETAPFPDVRSNAWYAAAIAMAQEYDLVQGYRDGLFRPDQPITRLEAIAVIARAMKIAGLEAEVQSEAVEGILSRFNDHSAIDAWARDAAAAVTDQGLVIGYNDRIMPHKDITRAEKATIIFRMLRQAGLID